MSFTLIVPIAADKDEYKTTIPYLFRLGDDGIMICIKSILGLDTDNFDAIYFVILESHDKLYYLSQMFELQFRRLGLEKKARIFKLDQYTRNQAETLYKTVIENKIKDSVMFKDADSFFSCNVYPENSIAIFPLDKLQSVNPQNKAYVLVDNKFYITNIIEKKIISQYFCAGGYIFENVDEFIDSYLEIQHHNGVYLSHIIFNAMLNKKTFRPILVENYKDWGTKWDFNAAGL